MIATAPTLPEVRELAVNLQPWVVRTPVLRCRALEDALGNGLEIHAKLEFLQQTGTFKARGALSNLLSLDATQRAAGVTAVSAGNHAIATAFAARAVGTTAKVVMMKSANPFRVARCEQYGAEIVTAEDAHAAFELVDEIQQKEGRVLIHPFEGPNVARGTATLGLEIHEQVPDADAVIVAIGGGGLCGGMASAVKQANPRCQVIGVEPAGADTMRRSFASGKPERIDRVDTIADSLGAPFAGPLSFALCREFVDDLVLVSDDDLRRWMGWYFHEMKMALEPACVAGTAALADSLTGRLRGRRVVLILCGSNIDWESFERLADLDT
ncbi:MAG: pyridoxal-phosphate dependent enzyme [Gammaproteobacteria bacterium]|nr:pyridoxal-phosphate dependent enzyme [Gammaproteobacteria bacterium]